MIRAIDRLFQRLGATYGASWDRSLGDTPISDIKTVWAHELEPFKNSLHRIAWALENLPERCPNVIEFKGLCRKAPAPELEALPEPKANPERVAAELAKLGYIRLEKAPQVGRLDWAHKIIERKAQGAKISPTVLAMAQGALKQ